MAPINVSTWGKTGQEYVSHSSNVVEIKENFGGKVKKLELWEFQKELAAAALRGENTIIVAPTSSGKTWVAVEIIKDHLETRRPRGRPLPKVVFLVPTTPLVAQQSDVFKRYLQDKYHIGAVMGGDCEAPKGTVLRSKDLTVMTPQCLVNVLTNPSRRERMLITDFSLLIFDECHHCDSRHPYMEIMLHCLNLKLEKAEVELPQVVGLTASLGAGLGLDLDRTRCHIVRMAANLDSAFISMVVNCKDDLEQHVTPPKDELVQVSAEHQNSVFSIFVNDTMGLIEGHMKPDLEMLQRNQSPVMEGLKVSPQEAVTRQRYRDTYQSWVGTLLNSVPAVRHSDVKQSLISCLQHLKIYQTALELHAHIPPEQAVEFLRSSMGPLEGCQYSKTEIYLVDEWHDLERRLVGEGDLKENPMAEKLRAILLKEYQKSPDSRTIIFVRTRELTKQMKICIENTDGLKGLRLNPEFLISANNPGGEESLSVSVAEQAESLSRFRDGRCKVLVATTVAEEGLDIEKCNLIIKYNHVTNEVALVQRRGRGRAEGSRSVLLAQEGSIADIEMNNLIKEKSMMVALKAIRSAGPKAFRKQVEYMQNYLHEKRQEEKELKAKQVKYFAKDKTYWLYCWKCDAIICHSNDLRQVRDSHYVCVDSQLWTRSLVTEHPSARYSHMAAILGKLACGNCKGDRGVVVKFKGVYLPTISGGRFTIVEAKGGEEKIAVKKWRKATTKYFDVRPISDEDLCQMQDSLRKVTQQSLDDVLERLRKKWEDEAPPEESETEEEPLVNEATDEEDLEEGFSGDLI